jgi:hypothetical protein
MDYFKHDMNASEDDKICDLLANGGYEMLGYYWRFVEYLYNRGGRIYKNKIKSVAWSLHMDFAKLNELIKNYDLFCEDEEIGALGADKFIKSEIAQSLEFNYIIEFDRKGKNDAVFYSCDNEDFEKFITQEYYKSDWGSFSDISVIAPFLGCAAVNLSCGYYNPHTLNEYVVLGEMDESINQACKILERTTENDKFEYIEAVYDGKYDWSSYGYDEKYYYIEWYDTFNKREEWKEVIACSKVEAVGRFLMDHPTLS